MSAPIFQPGDKIILINDKPYGPGNPYNLFTPYIVMSFDAIGLVYQVVNPNQSNIRFYIQLDIESRFRLATQDEIKAYF